MKKFPKDFIFGAATAAYQSEGALFEGKRGKNYWDDYLKEQGVFDPGYASDFYHKFPEDLELSKQFGINGLRISIAWSRIFPDGSGEIDPVGVDFYHRLIDECRSNGVEPFVTLHHFDTPLPLYKKGDWLSSEMMASYVDFANFCFKEYGSKVHYWITINEPWSVVAGQYIIGHFPPNMKYDIPKAIQSMHNMMVAHAKVVQSYKEAGYSGEIGIVQILESKYPISELEEDKRAALKEHVLANQFLLDATFEGSYSKETVEIITDILEDNDGELNTSKNDFEVLTFAAKNIDFIGINYYASHFLRKYEGESQIRHNGTGEKGSSIFAIKGVGERVNNPKVPTTDWDWPIYPQGLEDMLIFVSKKYPNYKKIYVTENGLGAKDVILNEEVEDSERIEYIRVHLQAILNAIDKGVVVQGYFLWSLMDVFSWTNGYTKRYGLFYVDFDTQNRYPKKSAYWYKKISEKRSLE